MCRRSDPKNLHTLVLILWSKEILFKNIFVCVFVARKCITYQRSSADKPYIKENVFYVFSLIDMIKTQNFQIVLRNCPEKDSKTLPLLGPSTQILSWRNLRFLKLLKNLKPRKAADPDTKDIPARKKSNAELSGGPPLIYKLITITGQV